MVTAQSAHSTSFYAQPGAGGLSLDGEGSGLSEADDPPKVTQTCSWSQSFCIQTCVPLTADGSWPGWGRLRGSDTCARE